MALSWPQIKVVGMYTAFLFLMATSVEEPAVSRSPRRSSDNNETLALGHTPNEPQDETNQPGPRTSHGRRRRLVIHGTGDVNLDPNFVTTFQSQGYEYAWSGMDGLFTRDDLTVVNLECPVSNIGEPVPKDYAFRCDPDALPSMRRAGVEVANLANNHSQDYGLEALWDSVFWLYSAGIKPVGVGAHHDDASAPALFTIKGWRVAVIGLGGVSDFDSWYARRNHPGMANGNSIPKMVAAVEQADEVADLVFVTIHWGVEGDTQPRVEDVRRAEAMIDAGADGIFGHHSHVLNPLGTYKGRPVAWSLGDFVWPVRSPDRSRTAVARFIVKPDGTISAELLPVYIGADGRPDLQ